MSRRAPIPDQYFQRGDVYILHLDPPYKHAAHYSGTSESSRFLKAMRSPIALEFGDSMA